LILTANIATGGSASTLSRADFDERLHVSKREARRSGGFALGKAA
jgi:hypothetical protein